MTTTASSTTTMIEIGTNLVYAAKPAAAPALDTRNTRRISSVAYAVEEMASLEKTGSATFFESRWCCSSAEARGLPSKILLKELAIRIPSLSPVRTGLQHLHDFFTATTVHRRSGLSTIAALCLRAQASEM